MKDGNEGQDLALQSQPDQIVGRPVGRVCSDPIGLQAEAVFGAVEHLAHGTNLGGLV